MAHGQPAAEPGTQVGGGHFLEGIDARAHPPQEDVDPGLEPDRGVGDRPDAGRGPVRVADPGAGGEPAAVVAALLVAEPAPRRIEAEREGLDVDLLVGGHRSSRIHVARSAAAYVITIPAPARTIPVTASVIARRPSIQPRSAAAAIIANSPDTW